MPKKKRMDVTRVLVMPDQHYPLEDERTMWAVERLIERNRFDAIVDLGDKLDLACISPWNENKPGVQMMQTQLEDDLGLVEGVLDRQLSLLRKNNRAAKYHYIQGNHEFWANRMAEQIPALGKTLDIPRRLALADRGVEWVPFWEDNRRFVRYGKATFIHGYKTTQFHTKGLVDAWGRNVYCGHTHDVQEFSKELMGDDSTIVGKSLGTLCRYDMPYLRGRPTKWQQAVAVFDVYPDGLYTEHTMRIFKHRFTFEGFVYDGRDRTVTKFTR